MAHRSWLKVLLKCNTFISKMCKKVLLAHWFILVVFFLRAQATWPPEYLIQSHTPSFFDLGPEYWQILEDRPGTLDIREVSG